MVATDDGGPRDIRARCENGLLVDVTDPGALQEALEMAGHDPIRWRRWSDNGVEAVSRHFSWDAHVCRYLALMQQRTDCSFVSAKATPALRSTSTRSRMLVLDLDSSLDLPAVGSLNDLREQVA
jgi:sucrose-phosphate synthase